MPYGDWTPPPGWTWNDATGWKPPTERYYGAPVTFAPMGCVCPVGAEITCRSTFCARRGPFDLPYQGE